jgi:hypothetical protein
MIMKKKKYSTISVMTKTQKAVKANSEKRGMTQSEYVDRAVTDFERNAKFKARRKADLNLEDMTYEEVLAFVATSLSALSKRNDVSRIISFIRKQEEEILTPMRNDMAAMKATFSQLLDTIKAL